MAASVPPPSVQHPTMLSSSPNSKPCTPNPDVSSRSTAIVQLQRAVSPVAYTGLPILRCLLSTAATGSQAQTRRRHPSLHNALSSGRAMPHPLVLTRRTKTTEGISQDDGPASCLSLHRGLTWPGCFTRAVVDWVRIIACWSGDCQ